MQIKFVFISQSVDFLCKW